MMYRIDERVYRALSLAVARHVGHELPSHVGVALAHAVAPYLDSAYASRLAPPSAPNILALPTSSEPPSGAFSAVGKPPDHQDVCLNATKLEKLSRAVSNTPAYIQIQTILGNDVAEAVLSLFEKTLRDMVAPKSGDHRPVRNFDIQPELVFSAFMAARHRVLQNIGSPKALSMIETKRTMKSGSTPPKAEIVPQAANDHLAR